MKKCSCETVWLMNRPFFRNFQNLNNEPMSKNTNFVVLRLIKWEKSVELNNLSSCLFLETIFLGVVRILNTRVEFSNQCLDKTQDILILSFLSNIRIWRYLKISLSAMYCLREWILWHNQLDILFYFWPYIYILLCQVRMLNFDHDWPLLVWRHQWMTP